MSSAWIVFRFPYNQLDTGGPGRFRRDDLYGRDNTAHAFQRSHAIAHAHPTAT